MHGEIQVWIVFFFFKELKDQHYQNYKHLEKKIKIKENRVGPCYLSDRGKGGRKEKALKHEKQQTIKMTEYQKMLQAKIG